MMQRNYSRGILYALMCVVGAIAILGWLATVTTPATRMNPPIRDAATRWGEQRGLNTSGVPKCTRVNVDGVAKCSVQIVLTCAPLNDTVFDCSGMKRSMRQRMGNEPELPGERERSYVK